MKAKILNICTSYGILLKHRILCTVSGGMDSVAMLRVLVELGFDCSIAHCNFKLRGEESDGDEVFVNSLAEKFNIPIYTISFNTAEYADNNNISIQMAARELRYEWFEKIRKQHSIDYIAVAHHADDAVETVLINIVRGTGISGLTGIPILSGKIFRPLMHTSRESIAEYCQLNKMKYRNDSSNEQTKYSRNLIRHKVIPILEQINPAFKQTMQDNIKHFEASERLLNQKAAQLAEKYVKQSETQIVIDLSEITEEILAQDVFFEMIRNLDFNASEASEIIRLFHSQAGKMLTFTNCRVLKDRNTIIIEKNVKKNETEYSIEYGTRFISEPIVLHLEYLNQNKFQNISNKPNIASIDISVLNFPLYLRRWKKGDRFMPLGMKNFKKLSDFFRDIKLSEFDKENIWLLCSDEDIVWIVGHRIDERFKIQANTKEVLHIRI